MSFASPIAKATDGAYRYQPETPKRPEYSAVRFSMKLLDSDSADGPEEVTTLEPGKRYQVKLQAEPAPAHQEDSVSVSSPLTLMLTLKHENSPIYEVTISPHLSEVPANATQFGAEFTLIMPGDLPDTDAMLCLEYKKTDAAGALKEIKTQKIKMAGTYNLVDTKVTRDCRINPAIERPEKTALLYVSPASGERKIRLVGWGHYKGHSFEVPTFKVPLDIGLGDFVTSSTTADVEVFAVAKIGLIERFFIYAPAKLTAWLDNLFDRHREELTLVITDLTDYEIPWEMYPLSDSFNILGANKYLGTNVSVARWGVFRNVLTKRDLSTPVHEEHRDGPVIAYIDPFDHTLLQKEKDLLQRLVQPNFLQTQKALHDKLNALHDTGLVYIGSHGRFIADRPLETGLGHPTDPTKRILLFYLSQLPVCQTERPLFFVNACHSARLHRVGDMQLGLHEVILANFASAYLGISGPINMDFSLEAAQFILPRPEKLTEGISLARRLRDFRAYVVEKYLGREDIKVLYAFMYVYYGNPLAYLHLPPLRAGEAEDD